MVEVERYASGAYETLATMAYDGLGQRRQLAMWVGGVPVTTTYTVDAGSGQVLVATTASDARYYLYGRSLVGEYGTEWVYHLSDGQGSARQLADGSGEVVLYRRFKPYGELWEEAGDGESVYGFLAWQRDGGLGLLYGNGVYYDPVTGRYLSVSGQGNPYLPYGIFDPSVMFVAPLAFWSAALGGRRRRRRRWWRWVVLGVVIGGVGLLVGCGTRAPTECPTITLPLSPTAEVTITLTPTPTVTIGPTHPSTAEATATDTPEPLDPTATPTASATPLPTPTEPPSATPIHTPTTSREKWAEIARITREDIQAYGGTMESYWRSESPEITLARIALAESPHSKQDRRYVMWIVKIRAHVGYFSNGAIIDEVWAREPWQFEPVYDIRNVFDPRAEAAAGVFKCGNNVNLMIYPCDDQNHPDDLNSLALTTFIETVAVAKQILDTPIQAAPEELSGMDSFVAPERGHCGTGKSLVPGGNCYYDGTDLDDNLWASP
jgi:hypothetical protein